MIEYVAIVDRGLKHSTIDDAALINKNIISSGFFVGETLDESCLFAIADGVGSKPGSEIAARITLKTIMECDPGNHNSIIDHIIEANECILDEEYIRRPPKGYACTLCLLAICQNKISSYNIGNSRLYIMNDNKLHLLTRDHTVAYDLYSQGLITYSDLTSHCQKNTLSTFLGTTSFNNNWIDYKSYEINLDNNSLIMLCSDGISDHIKEQTLELTLNQDISLPEKANSLIKLANTLGGKDNESIILIKPNFE